MALPVQTRRIDSDEKEWTTGDLFVFPSGTVVAWGIPEETLTPLVTMALAPATRSALKVAEEEDLEYVEDPARDNSVIKGDTIILGTNFQQSLTTSKDVDGSEAATANPQNDERDEVQNRDRDTVFAKIAFSSGLARSTKLAVLERLLDDYFESTKSIPSVLSAGGLPFTRDFITQTTGQLLGIRAQLNLYSDLTDSLPDLFWDSRHELGLEGYYDQVGRVLDTNIRIKILNQKMDYASEIASVLRQLLSERHGVRMEWIIIILIAVEVAISLFDHAADLRTIVGGSSSEMERQMAEIQRERAELQREQAEARREEAALGKRRS